MMKKNIINEVTKRILKEKFRTNRLTEAIEYDPQHPERMNPDIEGKLRSGEHIYGKSKSVPSGSENQNYSEKLASKRFKEIINKVKRYHGVESINPRMMSEMFSIMQEVGQIETNHKDALEKLAVDIVSEEFDIPDQMLEANLSPPGTDLNFGDDEEEEDEDFDSDFDVPKQPKSAERMEELEMEVDKRRILNALMQGASKKGHYIFHMVADELDALNPRLMVLYGKLMSLADFQYWIIPESSMDAGGAGGSEKIEWRKAEEAEDEDEEEEMEKVDIEEGDDIPVVVAKAWIFPLLVHELIKGTLELSAINWADGHLDFEEQTEVIEKADTIEGEIWGMRLGPGMWEKFLDCIDPDDYDIKQWLFHELSKLPAKQFHSFMKEILVGSQKCKEVIKTLKDLHNQEPSEGLDDMIDDTGYDDMGDVLDNLGAEVDDETPQETKDVDYSEMSRKEIEDLINDALDNGDFETVAKLHKYM
jgi:hypothetical protein